MPNGRRSSSTYNPINTTAWTIVAAKNTMNRGSDPATMHKIMAATLDAAFDEAAFYLDRDDTMEIDDDKYRRIARAFNPEIKEWQN